MAESVTMNFFECQQTAKRKTALLLLYLPVACFLIVCLLNLLAALALWYLENYHVAKESRTAFQFWHPDLFRWLSLIVVFIVGCGTVFNMIRLLRGGGKAVVAMFRAQQVLRDSGEPDEQKLMNVVEEVSIASGVPVPEVFVIADEEGINAFAAGLSVDHAVVVVTKGCMTSLNRDELQGVIAHEFSHILNGDMRLNLKLMASVNGLMVLSVIGWGLLENGDNAGLIVAGAVIGIIGSLGALAAKVIKSAVSRQREFLADAAAVQFTRNPSGIASALLKIVDRGSRISNYHATEASHLFFAHGLRPPWFGIFATHPPIRERVRRLDPALAAASEKRAEEDDGQEEPGLPDETGVSALSGAKAHSGKGRMSARNVAASVGSLQPEQIAYAVNLKAALPSALAGAAGSSFSSRCLIYALLISDDQAVGTQQLQWIKQHADSATVDLTTKLLVERKNLNPGHRLPLVDLCMPSLKALSPSQYREFRETIVVLAEADREISLFEYMLMSIVKRRLDPLFGKKKVSAGGKSAPGAFVQPGITLLSLLAWEGSENPEAAERAYRTGLAILGVPAAALLPREKCRPGMLSGVFESLIRAPLPFQKKILQSCLLCISADMTVTVEEAELLRAVGESLGLPVPPVVPAVLSEA